MSQDFTKAKIYKITNDYNDEVYIGSTCNKLTKRFSQHRNHCKNGDKKNSPLYSLMNEVGETRFRIQLICDYPCEEKYQLKQKEGEYIRDLGTLNKQIAGRTQQQYKEEHKEYYQDFKKKSAEKHKEENIVRKQLFYINNKERILQRQKELYEQNKEKINAKKKENYEKNKDKLNAQSKERYIQKKKTLSINN